MQRGFSLVETLVSLTLLAVVYFLATTAFSQIANSQSRLSTHIELAQSNLILNTIFQAQETCACHLTNAGNSALVLDISGNTSPDIDLGWIRTSCDFNKTTNYFAQAGTDLIPTKVKTDYIKLRRITKTQKPNVYSSEIEVKLLPLDSSTAAVSPMRQPILFEIDPATHRPLKCVGAVTGPRNLVCPSGFSMVGPPNDLKSFCVEPAVRPAANFVTAILECYQVKAAGFLSGSLCEHWELRNGCDYNIITGQPQELSITYTPGSTVAVLNSNNCQTDWGSVTLNDARPFRCCLR